MKIVVIGGTGLIGSQVVTNLQAHGHEAVPASPNTGVNTLTGEGLAEALAGAESSSTCRTRRRSRTRPSSSSSRPRPATSSTRDQRRRRAPRRAVGRRQRTSARQRLPAGEGGAGEAHRDSGIPYSIVQATQFFEFIGRIADEATVTATVRLPSGALPADRRRRRGRGGGRGRAGAVERHDRDRRTRAVPVRRDRANAPRGLGDAREVVADAHARYFDAELDERSLVPGDGARLLSTTYDQWILKAS